MANSSGVGTAGSYVSYFSNDGKNDITIVIETFGASDAQDFVIELRGALAGVQQLHLWTTQEGAVFVDAGMRPVQPGATLQVTVPANQLWTLSTTSGQSKNDITSPPPRTLSSLLPYSDTFNS
jgi:hypothetical protein